MTRKALTTYDRSLISASSHQEKWVTNLRKQSNQIIKIISELRNFVDDNLN